MGTSAIDALFTRPGHPLVHPALVEPTAELVEAVPEAIARRYGVLPVLMTAGPEGRTLWLAMSDPADRAALSACTAASGLRTRPMNAPADELRASFHRWYGGPAPRPAAPPPRRPKSILELDAADLSEIQPPGPRRAPAIVIVQAPAAMTAACRAAFGDAPVEIREIDLMDASRAVRDVSPFAIVVPDDVYGFDPTAFSALAIAARALLVTAEDARAAHLEPVLRTAYRSFFS